MLHVITSETGKPRLIVQDSIPRSIDDATKQIQALVMSETTDKGLDYNNLADRLHEAGFCIHGFRDFRTLGR